MSNPNQYPGHPAYGQPPMSYPGPYPSAAPGQYPPNSAVGYNQYPPAPYAYPPQAYAANGYAYPHQAPPYGAPLGYQQPQQPFPPPQQPYYPPHQGSMNPVPFAMSKRPGFQDWHPNATELQQIELWLQEVDPDRTGLARGATVVPLFTRSNLQKEVLKELWRLVDWNSQGSLDREQFTIAIRFLCILCNPIYAGSKPTVELFNQTISKDLSIPIQMLKQEAVNVASAIVIAQQESSSGLPSPINASAQPQYAISHGSAPYPPLSPTIPSYQPNPYQEQSPMPPHQHHQMPPQQPQTAQASTVIDEDEEFSDFAGASHEPTTRQKTTEETEASWDFVSAASTVVVHEPTSGNPSNISSLMDFDLLGSPSPILEKGLGMAHAEEEEAEFGEADFQQATPSPAPIQQQSAAIPSSIDPQTETIYEQAPQMPTLMSMTSMTSASKLSAFDELVEQDLMTAAVEGEDWDDFTDASPAKTEALPSSQLAVAQPGINIRNNDNPFDDFEDNAPSVFGSVPLNHAMVIEDTDDDFGDFESNHSPLPDAPVNQSMVQPSIVQVPVEAIQIQQGVKIAVVEEDEFGDFEEHTDSLVPNQSTTIVASHSNKLTVNPPMTPAMMEDLLDLLSDPVPMANHISNNGGLGLSFSKRSSADFLDLLSSTEPTAPSTTAIKMPSQPHHQEDEDESFGDFSSAAAVFAPTPAPVISNHSIVSKSILGNVRNEKLNFELDFDAQFEPFQSVPSTAKEVIADNGSLPSPIDQARPVVVPLPIVKEARRASNPEAKPLSRKELEALVIQLANKNLYDEAYACARQITLLKQMQELIELKNTALEKDDIEAAMKIKTQTTALLPLIEQQDEEQIWKEAAANKKRQGERLEDMYENLSLFNEALARKFKTKFMSANAVPQKSASIETRMRFQVLAKRSSRILLAISSSHRNHPAMWKQLIDHILPFLAEQQKVITAFQQLSAKEQSFVKASSRFQEYLLSLVALLEGGVWLAATCQEALMLESESNQLFASCQSLLAIVVRDCGTTTQLLGKTIEELSIQAGKVSERSGFISCNITFRPLSLTAAITDEKKDLSPYIGKKQGVHYQLALMNLWLQNIASTFPSSDGEFA